MKDYKIQLFSIQKLGFWRKGVARGSWGARDPPLLQAFFNKGFFNQFELIDCDQWDKNGTIVSRVLTMMEPIIDNTSNAKVIQFL